MAVVLASISNTPVYSRLFSNICQSHNVVHMKRETPALCSVFPNTVYCLIINAVLKKYQFRVIQDTQICFTYAMHLYVNMLPVALLVYFTSSMLLLLDTFYESPF